MEGLDGVDRPVYVYEIRCHRDGTDKHYRFVARSIGLKTFDEMSEELSLGFMDLHDLIKMEEAKNE